jgi:hypothetical protein
MIWFVKGVSPGRQAVHRCLKGAQTMLHPLVTQLQFTRNEFARCMSDVSEDDAVKRVEPLNCLSWIVGHMASHEQFMWLKLRLGKVIDSDLVKLVGFGQPASTPPWDQMWATWREITTAADEYLASVTDETVGDPHYQPGPERAESIGISLLRNIYHYWHHIGEAHAIRQILGHSDLPVFVGLMDEVLVK